MTSNYSRNVEIEGKTFEHNNARESENQKARLQEIHREEEERAAHASGTFGLTVRNLEDLMADYKERGSDFRDLQRIESFGGVDVILQKLKTNQLKYYTKPTKNILET